MSNWSHSPLHRFNEKGTYIVTGATYKKQHFFIEKHALNTLQDSLIELSTKYNWNLLAWAIFSNHYHFIAESSHNIKNLKNFIAEYHVKTATYINQFDNQIGRQVWFQYWDTNLTYHHSYLARLNYVMQNPVKHRLVLNAIDYPWCSAFPFKRDSSLSFIKLVEKFKIEQVKIIDDF